MRIFIAILLSSFLLTSVASAKGKMIFDLKKQYFSGTQIKKGDEGYGTEAKYDLEDVIVTTDTQYSGYSYKYGIFTIDIKKPLANWNVNIKKKNGALGETTSIRLTSDKGESYFITYDGGWNEKGTIQINDTNFPNIPNSVIDGEKVTASISVKNGTVLFKINGKIFLKSKSKDFGGLSKIEIELNDNHYDDELFSLDISKVD